MEIRGGDAGAKLRQLFALTSPSVVVTDLAVRDWSRHDQAVAERLRRVDNRRMDYLRSLFGALRPDADDVEARCTAQTEVGVKTVAREHLHQVREGQGRSSVVLPLVGFADPR